MSMFFFSPEGDVRSSSVENFFFYDIWFHEKEDERRARWMIDSFNNHFLFLHVVCLQASFSHYQDDCGCDSFTGITYFLF